MDYLIFKASNIINLGMKSLFRLLIDLIFKKSSLWRNKHLILNHHDVDHLYLRVIAFIYPRATETVTESQKSFGYKRPLEVIWSNIAAQAGLQKASGPGTCPDIF